MLFAASVIPTYAWFRQAITVMLPLGLLLLLASLVLDHLRSRRWQPLSVAVVLHMVARSPSRSGRWPLPFVVLALIVVVDGVRWRSARWWTLSAGRLGPFVVVNVLFLLAYLEATSTRAGIPAEGLSDAAVKVGRWALVDLLPAYLGGPVVWRSANGFLRRHPDLAGRRCRSTERCSGWSSLLAHRAACERPGRSPWSPRRTQSQYSA